MANAITLSVVLIIVGISIFVLINDRKKGKGCSGCNSCCNKCCKGKTNGHSCKILNK